MLETAHDEDLFEYYFTSQLATYDVATARKTVIGKPAIAESVAPSPNGEYFLVSKLKRPFSHLYGMSGFPKDVEIWTRRGEVARKVTDMPSSEGIPINGVQTGPRLYRWRADQPATITWVEALDEGNPKNAVPFRDRVLSLSAPFSAAPSEVGKTEWRYGNIAYTDKGVGLLTETDRATRRTRTWILDGGAPKKLWERRSQDAYSDPGTPVTRRTGGT